METISSETLEEMWILIYSVGAYFVISCILVTWYAGNDTDK
jgi:hypothetical protein